MRGTIISLSLALLFAVSPSIAGVTRVPLLVTPADIPDQILVEVTIGNTEHIVLRLDTAAPRTTMPAIQYSSLMLKPGLHDIWIGGKANGLYIGKKYVTQLEAIGTGPLNAPDVPQGTIVRGTAGTDLWINLAIGIDFQNKSLWLVPRQDSDPLKAEQFPHPLNVRTGYSLIAEFAQVNSSEGGVLFSNASFDSNGRFGNFLIDTGANTMLALSSYWTQIHQISKRFIPFDLADFQGNVISGSYRLGSSYVLGERQLSNEAPVWVLDSFPVLENEGAYFRRSIAGLIGLWGLYQHFTVLDFNTRSPNIGARVLLFPYSAVAPLEEYRFTGFGFTIQNASMAVRIVPGSDADIKGVQNEDILVQASGPPPQFSSAGVMMGREGETRDFIFSRHGQVRTIRLKAEKLLR